MQAEQKLSLIFHRAFLKEEFSGETPEDIVKALYENSKKGMGDISYEDWWEYQTNMWASRYGKGVPPLDTHGAHQILLDILVEVGALKEGALPQGDDTAIDNNGEPFVG